MQCAEEESCEDSGERTETWKLKQLPITENWKVDQDKVNCRANILHVEIC